MRLDPFHLVHKAIRAALAEMLGRMGAASFEDAAMAGQTLEMLEGLLAFCVTHAEHEERFVRPLCEGRIAVRPFDSGHPEQERYVAELRSLAQAVATASPDRRGAAGRALYLHFSAFVGDTLLHMGEEECVLLPMIHRVASDAELLEVQRRIVASMTSVELERAARYFLRAVSRGERIALVSAWIAATSPSAVRGLLESSRATLSSDVYAELVAVVDARANQKERAQ
jgi:hypothetical protein